jgi:hypothetical protein
MHFAIRNPGIFLSEPAAVANNVHVIASDAALAAELKAELLPLLTQACAIMNRGRERGLIVNMTLAPNQYGRIALADLSVLKTL